MKSVWKHVRFELKPQGKKKLLKEHCCIDLGTLHNSANINIGYSSESNWFIQCIRAAWLVCVFTNVSCYYVLQANTWTQSCSLRLTSNISVNTPKKM